jgi:Mrp family chromosome partitioning ATPase
MIGLIEELKQLADIVIFNTPPILTAADTALLASLVDGTILVVDSQSAQQEEASKALEMLRSVGARVLGAVLSNA